MPMQCKIMFETLISVAHITHLEVPDLCNNVRVIGA